MVQRALVLAGGGVAGIAWELGVLLGLQDGISTPIPAAGSEPIRTVPPIEWADLVIGTSAGSTVGAQIRGGTPLTELFDRQLAEESSEIDVDVDAEALMAGFASVATGATSPEEMRQRIGALALSTDTVPESRRRAAIAGRLLHPEWPERPLLIPAVDAVTGDVVVFTGESGVDLVDAVAASSAVPGVWPPVSIGPRRYIDGGVRSSTNADLAAGSDRVLVITPSAADVESPLDHLPEEIEQLRPAEVFVINADEDSLAAFGNNPLSPATRRPAAMAGRVVGRRLAEQVAAFWA